jgi:hypothetical protein
MHTHCLTIFSGGLLGGHFQRNHYLFLTQQDWLTPVSRTLHCGLGLFKIETRIGVARGHTKLIL